MVMGTVLMGLLIAGAAVFFTHRPIKMRKSEAEKAAELVEPVPPEVKAASFAAEGADAKQQPALATKLGPNGGSRTAGPRLTVEQCRELARIHRQNMLDRQHDNRMSAAAAVAGAVAGAALMHHHDAEAQQAQLDQMAAAQRAQQQLDADAYDADDYDADDGNGYSDVADDYDTDDQIDATEMRMTMD